MGLTLLTLACTIGVSKLAGGRLSALERLPVRGWPLLAGMLGALVIGTGAALIGLPTPVHWLALATAAGCAVAYCLRNRTVHGTGLVGAGLLLNALVVMLNDGMPVAAPAAARAGTSYAAAVTDLQHVPAGPQTMLGFLGDVVPVPLPLRPEVASAGDVLVAAGLAQLMATAMLRGPRAPRPAGGRLPSPGRRRGAPPRRAPAQNPPPTPDTDTSDSAVVRIFRPGEPPS